MKNSNFERVYRKLISESFVDQPMGRDAIDEQGNRIIGYHCECWTTEESDDPSVPMAVWDADKTKISGGSVKECLTRLWYALNLPGSWETDFRTDLISDEHFEIEDDDDTLYDGVMFKIIRDKKTHEKKLVELTEEEFRNALN